MTKDKAIDIIFSSPQYLELMKALEDAKQQLSPDEWQEVSRTLMNDVETFVARRLAELSEVEAGKSFRA
jgi:hypothetical protein